MLRADPPFEESGVDGVMWYIRHHHHNVDTKKKLLRKQILAGIVSVLNEVAAKQPRVVVGYGQGALIGLLCTHVLY